MVYILAEPGFLALPGSFLFFISFYLHFLSHCLPETCYYYKILYLMAYLKLGSIITDASGSLGGSVIQKGTSGYILRNKPNPIDPRSTSQFLIRSSNKKMQAGWIAATHSQHLIWNSYAKTKPVFNKKGEKHPLSGHSLWMKYQIWQVYYGLPFLTDPADYIDRSSYLPDTYNFYYRVTADGGTIIDIDLINSIYSLLQSVDALSSFDAVFLPYGGLKLRFDAGTYYVQKWYNLFGDNDLEQNTEALQLRYGTDQWNSIDVLTSLNSKMFFTQFNCRSILAVNGIGSGNTTGFLRLEPTYFGVGASANRYRTPASADVHNLINRTYRIDSLTIDGTNASAWRNKIASVDNPLLKSVIPVIGISVRDLSIYWNGLYGPLFLSSQFISTLIRQTIENYFYDQFALS